MNIFKTAAAVVISSLVIGTAPAWSATVDSRPVLPARRQSHRLALPPRGLLIGVGSNHPQLTPDLRPHATVVGRDTCTRSTMWSETRSRASRRA